MPIVTFELDDKGDLLGDMPTELQALLTRTGADQYKTGYGKGVEQAAKDAKRQIEETIALEKARMAAMEPLEKERVARIESENQTLSARMSELSKESDRLLKSREESHAKEIVDRTEKLRLRDERIQKLTRNLLLVDAVQAGARDESLDELEIILGNYLGFDDDMMPFVKGADGQPQMVAGKPISTAMFVKQYLDAHPHHRKSSAGRGGNATRGASLSGNGQPVAAQSLDSAKARIESGDRSTSAVNDLFLAATKRAG